MKKMVLLAAVLCFLLVGCVNSDKDADTANSAAEKTENQTAQEQEPAEDTRQEEPAVKVQPLPDTTMDDLSDTILAVSLEEGDAYVDDTGRMQMDLTIYTYDKFDQVDIAALKAGDTVVRYDGEVEVLSVERSEDGMRIAVNGGEEAGGFDLTTDETGVYYEIGMNDARRWYEAGKATIRVSTEFTGIDSIDPELGDVELFPGSFLVGEVTDYNFTPYNTTVRVEAGQVVRMDRIYTP